MQFHTLVIMVRLWWRGTWLGRLALLPIFFAPLIVVTLQDQEPHAAGIRWLLIVLDLAACAALAWILASLPAYFRAARSRVRQEPSPYQQPEAPRLTGSMEHPAHEVQPPSSPRALPRPCPRC